MQDARTTLSHSRTVSTSHGDFFVRHNDGTGTPLLMIHGNSSCHDVFARQFGSTMLERHRLVAIDLLGHGRSSDAHDPDHSYSLPGLAESVIELLAALDVERVAILGWSLGGNIATEMLAHCSAIKGIMLVGAPPVRGEALQQAFKGSPGSGIPGRRDLTSDEVEIFARAMFGDPVEGFLLAAIRRADGRFRERLFAAAREGAGVDQRKIVEDSPIPVAIVNGELDPMLRLEYFDEIAYGNLWTGQCYRIPGAAHAAFWQAPEQFNSLLSRFLSII